MNNIPTVEYYSITDGVKYGEETNMNGDQQPSLQKPSARTAKVKTTRLKQIKNKRVVKGLGGWDCYISLLCSRIISTLLQALRALAKSSIIFQTQKLDITMLV